MNIDDITDELGRKIDNKIRPLVGALLKDGFHTIQSCEGHKDWGLQYPWVDVLETDNLDRLDYLIRNYNSSSKHYWIHRKEYALGDGSHAHRIFPISPQGLESLQFSSIGLATYISKNSTDMHD